MEEVQANSELPLTSKRGNPFRTPVTDENLENEILLQWSQREYFRRFMNLQKAEVLIIDAVLGELFYRMKRKLSKPGRDGEWSAWLKQHNIMRNTADRVILDFKEFFGLNDAQPNRDSAEPKMEKVCKAAYRISDGLENMLHTPESKMMFVRCLADFFQLKVDFEGDSIRLSIPPSVDANRNSDEEAGQ